MQQKITVTNIKNLGAGLVTFPNLFNLPEGASPNCLDVKFGVDNSVEKRLGSDTTNATVLISSAATGFNPDSGGTLATNLNAFWALEEQSGIRLDSLTNNNLTDNNTVGFRAGVIGNAALFVAANSESLSIVDNAALSAGSTNFSISTWVNLTTKTLDQVVVSKYSGLNSANQEYRLFYDAEIDRFSWMVRGGTTVALVTENSLGSPSTATWILLTAGVNSGTSTVFFRANTFLMTSASFAVGVNDGAAPFALGVANTSAGFKVDTGGNLQSNLIAYWKLEEASGTRLDATGRGNNLTDNNTVTQVIGRVDNAASFARANSESLSLSDNADLSVSDSDFTFASWVFMTDTIETGQIRNIFSKDFTTTSREYALRADSLGFDFIVFGSPTGSVQVTTNGFGVSATSRWIFLVAWHDSANNTLNLQVDNIGIGSSGMGTVAPFDGSAQFRIGGRQDEDQVFWNGRIDEVGFWKRLLTASERSDLYRASSGNRFSTDYVDGAIDQTGFWRKALSNQEIIDLYNGGNANNYAAAVGNSGFGMFDFGAGLVSGQQLRWLTVAAGTGIFASSNRGVSVIAIATDRGADYQEFTGSRSFLIATSNTQNKVLVWPGSVGTFMTALAPGSAPPAKHALDFAGFLMLMNHSGGLRQIRYADNTLIQTDPWTSSFTVEGELDDEITGGLQYERSAYLYTKHTVSRVSHVGGNPDFSTQLVKSFGAIPRTIQKASYLDLGEVMISFGYDRHVRIFDGSEDRIISTPIEQRNGMSNSYLENVSIANLEKSHATVDTEEQTYRLWVVMSPSTEVTHCFNLNLRTGAWYPYLNTNVNAAVMAESGNSRILMAVKRDGFIHILNSGNTDSGTAIAESYDSPILFGESPRTVTKDQKMSLYFFPTSSGTIYYSDRANLSSSFGSPRERIFLIDTSTIIQVNKLIDLPRTQNVYQFRLSSSSATTTPWKMTRVDFEHQDMGVGGG